MTELTSLQRGNERSGCVLAYGHFTTIHPGHIRYLRSHARDLGSDLVVALEGDGLKICQAVIPSARKSVQRR